MYELIRVLGGLREVNVLEVGWEGTLVCEIKAAELWATTKSLSLTIWEGATGQWDSWCQAMTLAYLRNMKRRSCDSNVGGEGECGLS